MTIPRPSSPRAGAEPYTLEQLVASEGAFVARTLRRAGVLEDTVDDAVQQVFVVAARRLADVRAGSGRAFLVGVALNVAAHARRRATRRPEVDDAAWENILDGSPLPDDALDNARLGAVVTHALEGLSDELRAVLLLVDVEEHTMAHAAELLRIPRGTVASRLRRARADLAAAVARERPSRAMRTSSGARRLKPP